MEEEKVNGLFGVGILLGVYFGGILKRDALPDGIDDSVYIPGVNSDL